jgi:AraC-like DNA-binding protein
LSHPAVNIVFEADGATVSGVTTTRTARELAGRGRAVGVMFRPAGFHPFLGASLSTLTDRTVPLTELFPTADVLEAAVPGLDVDVAIRRLDEYLSGRIPAERGTSEDVSDIVDEIATDRSIRRVDDLAERQGVSIRQLQRWFADYVGVAPKWVIRRYRLYEAAEATAKGEVVDWSEVAASLGYSDQAHLTRDFTTAVGVPPDRYARENRQEMLPPSLQVEASDDGSASTPTRSK